MLSVERGTAPNRTGKETPMFSDVLATEAAAEFAEEEAAELAALWAEVREAEEAEEAANAVRDAFRANRNAVACELGLWEAIRLEIQRDALAAHGLS